MNYFLLILFAGIGISGIFYKVDAGVFVGLSLLPWQIIRLRYSKKLNITAIIITAIVGSTYFMYVRKSWKLLLLFLFVELYNYWGNRNTEIKKG